MQRIMWVLPSMALFVCLVVLSGCSATETNAGKPPPEITQSESPEGAPTRDSTNFPDPGALLGIDLTEDAKLAISPPTHITVEEKGAYVEIAWLGTGDDRIKEYQLYRKEESNREWKKLNTVPIVKDNRGTYFYNDQTVSRGMKYQYGISAVYPNGSTSDIKESVEIQLKP